MEQDIHAAKIARLNDLIGEISKTIQLPGEVIADVYTDLRTGEKKPAFFVKVGRDVFAAREMVRSVSGLIINNDAKGEAAGVAVYARQANQVLYFG